MESMQSKKLEEILISPSTTILYSLKLMDRIDCKLLLVCDNDLFIGLLSIGDIQRAIINNVSMELPVNVILRKNPRYVKKGTPIEIIRDEMIKFRMEFMPVITDNLKVDKVFFWENIILEKKLAPAMQFNLPVVIMAGGMGTRLKPLTNVLPKPLIPIGEKTMLEDIFERFANHGCDNFYISVNYKADLIKYYIYNQKLPYRLHFFKEKKPMGTAGSLSLLKNEINGTFFVSNCDILIEQDYSEILNYHYANKNEITIVAALKHYPLAYGIIETGENGKLLKLVEKPELTFKINSGMYILEPHLLDEIPGNQFFHITQLIEKIISRKGNVGVFPVSERSWKDIGNWEEYQNYINAILKSNDH